MNGIFLSHCDDFDLAGVVLLSYGHPERSSASRPGTPPVRIATRRGVVELAARQDDSVPDGVVFIPFVYVEAGDEAARVAAE
jgi:formate dehydrogenase major subunit